MKDKAFLDSNIVLYSYSKTELDKNHKSFSIMPRKPRVEDAGLHHIINRGVARGDIFLKDKDFEEFLQNVQIAKDRYDFIVHSLCLMGNTIE